MVTAARKKVARPSGTVASARRAPVPRDASQASDRLLADVRDMIRLARQSVAVAVNMGLTMLYWRVGQRIHQDLLGARRADYGEQIVATLSRQLAAEYGRGFEEKNLRRMVQFAEAFPDEATVATLWRHLSWSHFRELLPLKAPLQREFYAEMCRVEGWSVRTLAERIDSMLYERTALSRQPAQLIQQELARLRAQGDLTPALVLKDPYVLDFVGLADRYVERDLEDAILRSQERGAGAVAGVGCGRHPRGRVPDRAATARRSPSQVAGRHRIRAVQVRLTTRPRAMNAIASGHHKRRFP